MNPPLTHYFKRNLSLCYYIEMLTICKLYMSHYLTYIRSFYRGKLCPKLLLIICNHE